MKWQKVTSLIFERWITQSAYRGRGEIGGVYQHSQLHGVYCTPQLFSWWWIEWKVEYVRAPPTLTRLGWFYHHDGMYARKWPLLLCVYILCGESDARCGPQYFCSFWPNFKPVWPITFDLCTQMTFWPSLSAWSPRWTRRILLSPFLVTICELKIHILQKLGKLQFLKDTPSVHNSYSNKIGLLAKSLYLKLKD